MTTIELGEVPTIVSNREKAGLFVSFSNFSNIWASIILNTMPLSTSSIVTISCFLMKRFRMRVFNLADYHLVLITFWLSCFCMTASNSLGLFNDSGSFLKAAVWTCSLIFYLWVHPQLVLELGNRCSYFFLWCFLKKDHFVFLF